MNVIKPTHDVLGNLRGMVLLLKRLTGAKLEIVREVKYQDDRSFRHDGMVHVRFINRGQAPVLIDDQQILLPGEAFIEGDTAGPGIDHAYQIRFLTETPTKTPLPAEADADPPFTLPGNYLDIRVMRRKH
ncbi:hypothetical protein [Neolewinella agarilytica]|uniref:Uncharacterized protein n=1 Tax=Neolewinella agarilytica TaxID=478744 RepID=A0A1H9LYF8_9BACT|nr:hypothetical protein [Neolewinella agarilytica]SER16237.1 hypothetical protein SAMN05444359_12629 [Neolewinella agarilytica]